MPGHHRVFIETDRAGSPVFVRRRPSNSSSHRPVMNDERIHILRDEIDRLRERDRDLTHSYSTVLRQNDVYKAEIQRLQRSASDHVAMIHRLQHEKSDLRKEADSANNQVTRFQNKYREAKAKNDDLERENSNLTATIREMTQRIHVGTERKVHDLKDQIEEWKRRYNSTDRTLSRMRENLNRQIEESVDLKTENTNIKQENEILRRSLDTAKRLLNRHGLYIP